MADLSAATVLALIPWLINPAIESENYSKIYGEKGLHRAVASVLFEAQDPLSTRARELNLTANDQKFASNTLIGEPKIPALAGKAMQPLICRTQSNLVLGVLTYASDTGLLESVVTTLLDPPSPIAELNAEQISSELSTKFTSQNLVSGASTSTVVLDISVLSSVPTVIDEICATIAVASALGSTAKIRFAHDRGELTQLKRILKIETASRRANRILNIQIHNLQDKGPRPIVSLNAQLSEGIFASPVASWSLEVDSQQIASLKVGPEFNIINSRIADEEKNTRRQEPPTTVKVYGAWAYLDKGRAYGLNIDDRLMVQGQGNDVEGHVVGFYGAKLGLKNMDGTVISEGAIVFVRKGQAKSATGQSWIPDKKKYPLDLSLFKEDAK